MDMHLPTAPVSLAEGSTRADWPLDLAAFAATPLTTEPFPHIVLKDFVRPEAAAAARRGFPGFGFGGVVPAPGSRELSEVDPGFAALIAAIRHPSTTAAFAAKFGMDLDPATLMVTMRDMCRAKDGRIHTDNEDKALTALIYLNDGWTAEGGRLRLLRGPDDLEDMIAEVPPLSGTLLCFRRTDRSWHGHKPFEGVRRSVMFNWMVDAAACRREVTRHAISSRIKRLAHPRPTPARSR